jgi:hypothetical protein
MYILGEVGTIDRFDTVANVKSYAKCCPKESSTGGRQDPYGVVQHGHSGLKWAFELIAETLVRYEENPVKAKYASRKSDTGHHGKAMAVARREVCELVYWLLSSRSRATGPTLGCWIASLLRRVGWPQIDLHACSLACILGPGSS